MNHIKRMFAVAFVLAIVVVATGASADESDAICYFGGQPYSTGAQICMKGNLARCDDRGEWQVITVGSPSCQGKPDGSVPGMDPSN